MSSKQAVALVLKGKKVVLKLSMNFGAVGFQGDTEVTVEVEGRGGGKGDLSSSSLELSKSPKAPEL